MALFNYLFYKFWRAVYVRSVRVGLTPRYQPQFVMAIALMLNIEALNALLVDLNLTPDIFPNDYAVIALGAAVFTASLFYYSGERKKRIIEKYAKESEKKRKAGNVVVWAYVFITMATTVLIPLYWRGKM